MHEDFVSLHSRFIEYGIKVGFIKINVPKKYTLFLYIADLFVA